MLKTPGGLRSLPVQVYVLDSRRAEVITCTGVCSSPRDFFWGEGGRSELINVLGTIFKMRTFFFFFQWLVGKIAEAMEMRH